MFAQKKTTKQGVYVIKFDSGVKIGHTSNMKTRLGHYTSPWCLPILDFYFLQVQHPKLVEASLMKYFNFAKIKNTDSREFFKQELFPRIVKKLLEFRFHKEKYMRVDKAYGKYPLYRLFEGNLVTEDEFITLTTLKKEKEEDTIPEYWIGGLP